MFRRAAIVAALLTAALSACSDDTDSTPSAATAPIAADSPAPVASGGEAPSPGAAFDCGVLQPLVQSATVNIQLIVQLASIPDVSSWAVYVGSLPDFDSQLAAMTVLEPFDPGVAEQLTFFRGADDIAQRGLGGDAAAPAELAAYLGDDIAATLARRVPFSDAMAAAGC